MKTIHVVLSPSCKCECKPVLGERMLSEECDILGAYTTLEKAEIACKAHNATSVEIPIDDLDGTPVANGDLLWLVKLDMQGNGFAKQMPFYMLSHAVHLTLTAKPWQLACIEYAPNANAALHAARALFVTPTPGPPKKRGHVIFDYALFAGECACGAVFSLPPAIAALGPGPKMHVLDKWIRQHSALCKQP